MTIYYLTILVLSGLGFIFTEKKKGVKNSIFYLTIVFLILTALASFRYAIGFDYFSYRDIYVNMSIWTFGDIFHYCWYEPLFFIACKLFSSIGCSFQFFLFVINIFLFFIAVKFIYRYSKLPWMSVYLYITLQFLAYNMNLIRQSIAVAFFLLAYPYLKNRKLLPFSILFLIGGLFHNSLLFLFPFYFLLPKKLTKKFLAVLFVLILLGYFLFDPVFSLLLPFLPEKYVLYQTKVFWNSNSFKYIVPSATYCILIYLFRNRIDEPNKRTIYLNSALYTFLISLFITKHFILERFSIYPFVLSLIAIPEIITSYQNKDNSKGNILIYHRVLFLFLLFGGLYFLFSVNEGFHNVYPYVSLLDKSGSSPN